MKTRKFNSYAEFEIWSEENENIYIPTVIDDGWKISASMMIDCKSYKTALRHFRKAFAEFETLQDWANDIEGQCEEGIFTDVTGWRNSAESDDWNYKSMLTFGAYGWGVEEVDEGVWYIFMNVSGEYAGYTAKAA